MALFTPVYKTYADTVNTAKAGTTAWLRRDRLYHVPWGVSNCDLRTKANTITCLFWKVSYIKLGIQRFIYSL